VRLLTGIGWTAAFLALFGAAIWVDPAVGFALAIPVVLAVAGAAITGAISGATLSSIVISAVVSGLLAAAKMALSGKPKAPEFTPFTAQARDRTHIVRSATEPQRIIYGTAKVSGPLVGAFSTDSNNKLHMVVPLAGHKIARFHETYFNDTLATDSRFSSKYRLSEHLGTCDQAADSDLVSEVSDWTTNHRLRGLAYIYARLDWNRDTWPTGIPNVASVVDGREVYDPRDTGVSVTSSTAADPSVFTTGSAHGFAVGDRVWLRDHAGAVMTVGYANAIPLVEKEYEVASVPTTTTLTLADPYRRSDSFGADNLLALGTGGTGGTLTKMVWSNNAALCLADYHWAPFGGNCDFDEVDETDLTSAANTCDEYVTVTDDAQTFTADASTDEITIADHDWETGDRFQVSTTDTLPTGLSAATNYYWIRTGPGVGMVASSLANARAGTQIDITGAGSGTHTATKNAQLRYTVNGAFSLDALPPSIVEDLLTAMMGARPYAQGVYRILAGVYESPTKTVDESYLAGEIDVTPYMERSELYNAVRGTFVDPANLWVATDFPLLTNETYEGEDGGERIYRDIELPFTTDVTRAQRLANIALLKSRQAVTAVLPCNWKALEIALWEVINVTIDQLGWSSKVFRVIDIDYPEDGGVTLTVQEESSTSYSWAAGDATVYDPAPNTQLPDPFDVATPGVPTVTETLYETKDGGGVKVRADLTWGATDDAFLSEYQVEYKLSADSDWIVIGRQPEAMASIFDLAPGVFDFRVKAINTLNISSSYATLSDWELQGLAAAPSAPAGLTISAAGGLAVLRFDVSSDLDVKQGGHGEFRWSPATSGATWAESASIGDEIPGHETVALLPLKAGSYLMKWVDSSGVKSSATTVTTKQATAVAYSNASTLAEETAFTGAKSGVVLDDDVAALKLTGSSNIDDWADVDSVVDWDAEGGIASSGTYDFATDYDAGSVTRFRATSDLTVVVYNALDQIDSRSGNVDDWEDWDGTGDAAPADAQIWARETDDDPSGTPTWSSWQRLDSAEFQARALDFELRMSSSDPAYNIRATTCGVSIDTVS
jgi:hypothetical protein